VALPAEFIDLWKSQACKLRVGDVPLTKLSRVELLAVAASAIVQLDEMHERVEEAAEQRRRLATVFVRSEEKPFHMEN